MNLPSESLASSRSTAESATPGVGVSEVASDRRDEGAKRRSERGRFEGARLVVYAALLVAAVVTVTALARGFTEEGLRENIRMTARLSVVLFLLPFAASAVNALWRRPWTKWLLRNRRYLGLSFAVSQFTHLAFVLSLSVAYTSSFLDGVSIKTLTGGSIGYLFLALMTATSFDRSAAWLGRRRWRQLHLMGIYLLWAIFLFSYVEPALAGSPAGAFVVPLLAAVALRAAAAIRRRERSTDQHR